MNAFLPKEPHNHKLVCQDGSRWIFLKWEDYQFGEVKVEFCAVRTDTNETLYHHSLKALFNLVRYKLNRL